MSVVPKTPPVIPPGAVNRRMMVWIGIIVLFLVAGVMRWRMTPADDPLRGDAEDTLDALEINLDTLPENKRLDQLIRFADDASPGLRFNAIEKLSERRDAGLGPLFEKAYADSSSVVRGRALETLQHIEPKAGLRLLLAGLQDEDYWMRDVAIQQLKVGYREKRPLVDKRIVPALIAALDDSDAAVPFIGTYILSNVAGNPWRYKNSDSPARKQQVIDQWKKWWQTEEPTWQKDPTLGDIVSIHPMRRDPAPDFQMKDLNGRLFSLAGQKGRITLLNFWGTWCPPCQVEIPALVQVDREYRQKGVDIIGVALAEKSGATLREWCAAHQVGYPQVLAPDRVLKDYGDIHEVPVSFLIDGEGKVRRRWEGERDYETFRAAIEDVIATTKRP